MLGVKDTKNPASYINCIFWRTEITSQHALQRLTAMLTPQYFRDLIGVAKGNRDPALEGIAFEGLFHSAVQHHDELRLLRYDYDNVSRPNSDPSNLNRTEILATEGRMIWNSRVDNMLTKIETSGESQAGSVAIMREWAAKPRKLDYWRPRSKQQKTVDAVIKSKSANLGHLEFCFIQITKAGRHRYDEDALWMLAQPFVEKGYQVSFIAIVPSQDQALGFRWDPVAFQKPEMFQNVRLYVAYQPTA